MEQIMNRQNSSTSSSKRKKTLNLVLKCLVMLALVFVFLFYIICPQYDQGYQAAMQDKVARLKAIDEPKIVLLGNSNVAFGFDSQLIEEEMGMPVVNMGLHGGLGNAFQEMPAKLNVTEGDIYVVCHTYYNDYDTFFDPSLVWTILENNWELYSLLRWQDLPELIEAYPTYVKKWLNLWSTGTGNQPGVGIYSRDRFNEYGDIGYHEGNYYTFTEGSISVPGISDICVNRLNELSEWLEERGASLVIAGYPIPDGEFTPDKSEYIAFQEELEERMNFPVISDFTDYFIPYEYFYDTYAHLTTMGTVIRSEQLVEDLKNWLGGE